MNKQITLGGGCFWCIEAVLQRFKGISSVVSGYAGGHIKNPCYREICTGNTGHAEVVQISYDSTVISLEEILEIFWTAHDPTTLNRQGADRGTQYRSVVYYADEAEKEIIEKSIAEVASQMYADPIVTEVSELPIFYPAEDNHQNYYNLNATKNPYCSIVISPKVTKTRQKFAHLLKEEYQ